MSISLRDPKTQKTMIFSIVGIAVLYVYLLTDVAPFTYRAGASELEELSTRYKRLSSDLTKARQTLKSLPYLEQEFDLLHQQWNRAQRLLPDEQETASLLRAIALLGDQSGIKFLLFRPVSPVPAQYHTEHPIEIEVEGGYHEIATFLSELANMERILNVTGLELRAPKRNESTDSAIASFTAKTYTLGGAGVPPEEGDLQGQKKMQGRGSLAKQANRAKQTAVGKLDEVQSRNTDDE